MLTVRTSFGRPCWPHPLLACGVTGGDGIEGEEDRTEYADAGLCPGVWRASKSFVVVYTGESGLGDMERGSERASEPEPEPELESERELEREYAEGPAERSSAARARKENESDQLDSLATERSRVKTISESESPLHVEVKFS